MKRSIAMKISATQNTIKQLHIIIWRHAEAEDASAEISDNDRRLTPRGEKQARLMGRWLLKRLRHDAHDPKVLVSPTVRTQMTAQALGLPMTISKALAPGLGPEKIIAASGYPLSKGTAVLVGHQPHLGQSVTQFLLGKPYNLSIRKGAIWWLVADLRSEKQSVQLRGVMDPDWALNKHKIN